MPKASDKDRALMWIRATGRGLTTVFSYVQPRCRKIRCRAWPSYLKGDLIHLSSS
jgi:hypothetical protein